MKRVIVVIGALAGCLIGNALLRDRFVEMHRGYSGIYNVFTYTGGALTGGIAGFVLALVGEAIHKIVNRPNPTHVPPGPGRLPPVLMGQKCNACGRTILVQAEGCYCDCRAVFHKECLYLEGCLKCKSAES